MNTEQANEQRVKEQEQRDQSLTEAQVEAIKENGQTLEAFMQNKIVVATTPFAHINKAITGGLYKEAVKHAKENKLPKPPKKGSFISTAVNLFNEDREKLQTLLEEAGFTVKELPTEIL